MAYSPLGAPARPEALNPGAKAVLQDPILASIGKKYGMSVAQVALKWQVRDQKHLTISMASRTVSSVFS